MKLIARTLKEKLLDPRLVAVEHLWSDFLQHVSPSDSLAIIHHGDLDGAIGGCYASTFLGRHFGNIKKSNYWVGTDEYDFVELRKWVSDQRFDHCFVFDMSIVNNLEALSAIASSIRGKVFIFDHHLVNTSANVLPDNVTLANPTPAPLARNATPVPTFLFALKLASKQGLPFPDWLLVLAMFAEGVDGFFTQEIQTLANGLPEMKGGGGDLRDRYRTSSLSRAATLIRAAYAGQSKEDFLFELLSALLAGQIEHFSDFKASLEARFSYAANGIAAKISNLVDSWSEKIRTSQRTDTLVIIPIDGPHAVAGPVVSIIRGKFPKKVIMGWIEHDSRRVIELRTGNTMPTNLVGLLSAVNTKIDLLNFGGHASAAGATINACDFEAFTEEFQKVVSEAYRTNGLS